MRSAGRQGELFSSADLPMGPAPAPLPPPLLRGQLQDWQGRIGAFQGPLFAAAAAGTPRPGGQGVLLAAAEEPTAAGQAESLDPLALQPQSLSFWRWPRPAHRGAALYLVTDRPVDLPTPLVLYVGETGRADRRWKGEHDCKAYLAAYSEALRRAGLEARLSIRFWCDVPAATRPRRALEQALIRRWLPPFNKETRGRWATPFTADPA
ncbi:MAG: GIY-YIG nuclease family protein [Synechococcaceae cyanobacterium]|nr:GIY-YIG nuclease family protein [Synechococcaceae cyanobacterium]